MSRQLDVRIISKQVDPRDQLPDQSALVCVLPPSHPLTRKGRVTARDLARRFISFAEVATRSHVAAIFRETGLTPNIVLDASVATTV